jgi:two-component system, cell cycle sensor histidine kinase and response regulator CckA
VSDTGCGMDEATQSRIFEPFFTTKEVGKGTGLGLATVFGIVKQSDGAIAVTSRVGGGSSFQIFLPLHEMVSVSVGRSRPLPVNGTATILVVEDDERLRTGLVRHLTKHGYRILEAGHGQAALQQLEDCNGQVDLLITDLVMPGIHGLELARRAAQQYPAIRVILMSGYAEHPVLERATIGEHLFLEKPFAIGDLTQLVERTLTTRPETQGSAAAQRQRTAQRQRSSTMSRS